MCGINGFTFKDTQLIKKMNQSIIHRGPDDGGEYTSPRISLGSRRLSIIDLSKNGHMPMPNKDKTVWIVFNGEIYNFIQLRQDLIKKGYKFKSKTDTEVILNGYTEYGLDFLSKLNGMFAAAIWDSNQNQLALFRDRVGIKPLYYSVDSGQLYFSSEIKALLAAGISNQLDPTALAAHFRLLYTINSQTVFKKVKKLPPGHLLIWKKGHIKINQYYNYLHQPIDWSHQNLVDILDQRLNSAVETNLISDRQVGLFLSGGIDSSLLLALASQKSSKTLHTYTVGFQVNQGKEKFNVDLNLAKHSADYFGTKHHQLLITPQDIEEHLLNVVFHMDEPISNLNSVAIYLLSQKASQDVTVVLGGDGGDELFAGYSRYITLRHLQRFNSLPKFFQNQAINLLDLYQPQKARLLKQTSQMTPVELYTLFTSQSKATNSKFLNSKYINNQALIDSFSQYFPDDNQLTIDDFLLTDFKTWLPNESLTKFDKLTMAHSIEGRVPLLNNEVVEFAMSLSYDQKASFFNNKIILRNLAKRHLPEKITQAPKWGFFSPVSQWIRQDLNDFVNQWITIPQTAHIIDPKGAKNVLKSHLNGGYHPHEIWAMVTFNCWYHQFFINK